MGYRSRFTKIHFYFLSIVVFASFLECHTPSLSPLDEDLKGESFHLQNPRGKFFLDSKNSNQQYPKSLDGYIQSRIWKEPRQPIDLPVYYHYYWKNGVQIQEKFLILYPKDSIHFYIPHKIRHTLYMDATSIQLGEWKLYCDGVPIDLKYSGMKILCGNTKGSELVITNTGEKLAFIPGMYFRNDESKFEELKVGKTPVDVIWIVVDSLRGDVIQHRHITPNLNKLLQESVYFSKHIVNASWTRPSTTVFFTGRYASSYSLNFWDYPLSKKEVRDFHNDKRYPLPFVLEREGIKTSFIGNNPFLVPFQGIGADFGFSHLTDLSDIAEDTPHITKKALLWNKKSKHFKGRFLFLNYNDPHRPYTPKLEFRKQVERGFTEKGIDISRIDPRTLDYWGEVAYVDRELGILREAWKEEGIWDNALVIVTSDHGEVMNPKHSRSLTVGTYTLFGHGQGLYEEDIHVPLIIKFPQSSIYSQHHGREIPRLTRSIDIYPTVLKELEINKEEYGRGVAGKDLQSILDTETEEREYYGETRGTQSYRIGNKKLIRKSYRFHRVGTLWNGIVGKEKDYYFDLEKDPDEINPVLWEDAPEFFKKDFFGEKLESASLPSSYYGIRWNDTDESLGREWKLVIRLGQGEVRKVPGKKFFTHIQKTNSGYVVEETNTPNYKEIYFQIYPDVSNPYFEIYKGGRLLSNKEWGVGSFDLNPVSCKGLGCEKMILARDGVPPPVKELRFQIWKEGNLSSVELNRGDLGKEAKEALKKQGYIQ